MSRPSLPIALNQWVNLLHAWASSSPISASPVFQELICLHRMVVFTAVPARATLINNVSAITAPSALIFLWQDKTQSRCTQQGNYYQEKSILPHMPFCFRNLPLIAKHIHPEYTKPITEHNTSFDPLYWEIIVVIILAIFTVFSSIWAGVVLHSLPGLHVSFIQVCSWCLLPWIIFFLIQWSYCGSYVHVTSS